MKSSLLTFRFPLQLVFVTVSSLTGCASHQPGDEDPEAASGPQGEDRTAFTQQLQAFSKCMRAHGLPNFPDPTADGELRVSGIDPNSPEYEAAFAACKEYFPPRRGGETTADAGAVAWQEITPSSDCMCADGSAYRFVVHAGSSEHVLMYLQSGGACFSAELCVPDVTYRPSLHDLPPESHGIFDFGKANNPFSDYTVVYVPYCSGDAFLGDATTQYSPELTIHHKGFANASAALDYLQANFAAATRVVVLGESAGAVAAPVYGGLAASRFPQAVITTIADSAGAYPDLPELNTQLSNAWNVQTLITALTGDARDTANFSLPGLTVLSGLHHPTVVFSRHDYSSDPDQANWLERIGQSSTDVASRIAANESAIESAGVDVISYTAPGEYHTVFTDDRFYDEAVDGITLVQWTKQLIGAELTGDVPGQLNHGPVCGHPAVTPRRRAALLSNEQGHGHPPASHVRRGRPRRQYHARFPGAAPESAGCQRAHQEHGRGARPELVRAHCARHESHARRATPTVQGGANHRSPSRAVGRGSAQQGRAHWQAEAGRGFQYEQRSRRALTHRPI
jgi:hypothetical protein